MSKLIKPLLASRADYSKIKYPVLATSKLDGIRCLMVDGVAMSRSMKPIPNKYIQSCLRGLHGLDGELMLNGDFNQVMSGIMSVEGEPDFTYHVFDGFESPDDIYPNRLFDVDFECHIYPRLKTVYYKEIYNELQLDEYIDKCLADGYEGVMIRQPNSRYKFGRSTVNEGILLKIKRFFDDEAILINVTEKMTNENTLEEDELGYAKRSSCKDNLHPSGTAGSIVLKWRDLEFSVGFGPGITDAIKQSIWDKREEYVGRLVKFRYQELSKGGVPRFGKMLSFRHEDDL